MIEKVIQADSAEMRSDKCKIVSSNGRKEAEEEKRVNNRNVQKMREGERGKKRRALQAHSSRFPKSVVRFGLAPLRGISAEEPEKGRKSPRGATSRAHSGRSLNLDATPRKYSAPHPRPLPLRPSSGALAVVIARSTIETP